MKKMIMTALAVLLTASHALAADGFVVSDITIPQGGSATLEIGLNNSASECKGFQFLLTFDKEVAVTDISKTTRYPDDWDMFNGRQNAEGYQVLSANAMNPSVLTGTSGSVVELTLAPDAELTQGTTITATLSNCFMSDAGANQTDFEDVTFTITIGEPVDTRTVLDELSTTMPEAATGVDVRVKRTIAANVWNTLVLPFDMTAEQVKAAFGNDVQLADFTGVDTEADADENIVGMTVNFQAITAIEANHPCLIKVSEAMNSFTVDGVNIQPEDEPTVNKDPMKMGSLRFYNSFVGTYVANTEVEEYCLFLNGNKFWYSTGTTKMKAYRAYFSFYTVLSEVDSSAGSKIRFVVDDEVTSIDGIPSAADKMGAVYNLNGQLIGFDIDVNSLPAGVYIKNGQKIVVK